MKGSELARRKGKGREEGAGMEGERGRREGGMRDWEPEEGGKE